MKFYVMTLFPEMIEALSGVSILKRATTDERVSIEAVNIRDYAFNKHGSVDDYPYGGGAGMLMQAEPVYRCHEAIIEKIGHEAPTVYLTPQGKTFDQKMAESFCEYQELILLCGHYEGIDERVIEKINPIPVSIGDFVLTGGELPAMAIVDAVSRLVPGVLNNSDSAATDTFSDGLLKYPQYSRPAVWEGMEVPPILLSGDHKKVEAWRYEESLKRTQKFRPDLYKIYMESKEDS